MSWFYLQQHCLYLSETHCSSCKFKSSYWDNISCITLTEFPLSLYIVSADSRFAPSQWETALLCNDVPHWEGATLKSALIVMHSTVRLKNYGTRFRAWCVWLWLNTLRPRQDARHFADDIFKCVFLNEDIWISINISLKFVPMGPINNISSIGSDNGLPPSRRQAIIWTNDDELADAYMRHSASMS